MNNCIFFHGNYYMTVDLIHLVSLEINWGCLYLSEVYGLLVCCGCWCLTWLDYQFWCIVAIWSLGVRMEVGSWEFWFVISMWASSSSDSESKASTISFLLWIFGFDGICVSCCFIVLLCLLFLLKLGYKVKIKHTHLHTFGLLFQCKHLQHLIQSQRHLQSHFYDGYSVLTLFVCLVVLLFLFSCYTNVHVTRLQQYLFPALS